MVQPVRHAARQGDGRDGTDAARPGSLARPGPAHPRRRADRARDAHGFPAPDALHALHLLEDRIGAFADGAVVVAHETCDGVRTTHLYTDRRAAAHALEPVVAGWPDGRVRLSVTEDPRWEAVAHLR